MHRTTINLDEAIYRRVIDLAHGRGKSLARTIEDLLRGALAKGGVQAQEPPLHTGNGALPGVDIADRDRLYDVMDER